MGSREASQEAEKGFWRGLFKKTSLEAFFREASRGLFRGLSRAHFDEASFRGLLERPITKASFEEVKEGFLNRPL